MKPGERNRWRNALRHAVDFNRPACGNDLTPLGTFVIVVLALLASWIFFGLLSH